MPDKKSILDFKKMKKEGEKLATISAYDFVAAQLAEIQKRLAEVSKKVDELETDKDAEAKVIEEATTDISADLKATHDASKVIDAALTAQLQGQDQSDEFSDRQSSDYYFTGEGHFID